MGKEKKELKKEEGEKGCQVGVKEEAVAFGMEEWLCIWCQFLFFVFLFVSAFLGFVVVPFLLIICVREYICVLKYNFIN